MDKYSLNQMLNITTGVLHSKMDDIYDILDKAAPGVSTLGLGLVANKVAPLILKKYPSLPSSGYYTKFEMLPEVTQKEFSYLGTDMDKVAIPFDVTETI